MGSCLTQMPRELMLCTYPQRVNDCQIVRMALCMTETVTVTLYLAGTPAGGGRGVPPFVASATLTGPEGRLYLPDQIPLKIRRSHIIRIIFYPEICIKRRLFFNSGKSPFGFCLWLPGNTLPSDVICHCESIWIDKFCFR